MLRIRTDSLKSTAVSFGVLTTAILAGLWIVSVVTAAPAAACFDCECYFASNCTETDRGEYCDYVGDCFGDDGCVCVNKPDSKIDGVLKCGGPVGQPQCDGLCRGDRGGGIDWDDVTAEDVATAFDLYLSAYIEAALGGGGDPEPTLLSSAQAVPLNDAWREEVEDDVHQILIVLLGRDFLTPQVGGACADPYGQVPSLGMSGIDLLETVRAAFVQGVRDGEASGIRPAIDSFWATDSFEPFHPHGCYPHGHSRAPDVATCQGNQIEGLLEVVIDGQSPNSVQPSLPAASASGRFSGAGR